MVRVACARVYIAAYENLASSLGSQHSALRGSRDSAETALPAELRERETERASAHGNMARSVETREALATGARGARVSAVSPSRGHSAVSVRESGVRGDRAHDRARPNVSLKSLNSHFTISIFVCSDRESRQHSAERRESRDGARAAHSPTLRCPLCTMLCTLSTHAHVTCCVTRNSKDEMR